MKIGKGTLGKFRVNCVEHVIFNYRFSEVQKIWQKKQSNKRFFATSKFAGKYLQYTLSY